MTQRKYQAGGAESEFQPGSRRRVLRNLLGITRVRDINEAESQALQLAQQFALEMFDTTHRFTALDICALHRLWLEPIYVWAGAYRGLNIGKGGFQFAHAQLIPKLMAELERGALRQYTPCSNTSDANLAHALAEVHAELILIHPFREGNGRLARLLSLLMALQAGVPPLDYTPMAGQGKRAYISSIHVAMNRDYAPLTRIFERIIERSRRDASSKQRKPLSF